LEFKFLVKNKLNFSLSKKVKIWFQNRRTKFKRKYTSDVETLASHYYSSLGIGGIARPMVVGDRLWLFSQPVSSAPPTPIHSLLLSNMPPQPQHFSPMMPTSRSAILTSSQQRPDYASIPPSYLNKSADFRFNKVLIKTPTEEMFSQQSSMADLETRFGHNSTILNENNKFHEAISITDDIKSSSSSDVDCEEIEINDEN
jgi:hypothetical protein